jgi:hypothetical protein
MNQEKNNPNGLVTAGRHTSMVIPREKINLPTGQAGMADDFS